jgi:hypothetical protein
VDFNKLGFHVEMLKNLLSDRQEGLVTWCQLVAKHWKAISDMWAEDNNQEMKS